MDFLAAPVVARRCVLESDLRLCLRVQIRTWTQSVPSAVADGCVAIGRLSAAHPPATAGGTDLLQVEPLTLEAKRLVDPTQCAEFLTNFSFGTPPM
jgi:hypothetical protein